MSYPEEKDFVAASQGFASWLPDLVSYEPGFRLFRRVFESSTARHLSIYSCADCRYKLYLDGKLIATGPVKSPVWYKQLACSEVDILPGRHVLAAEVVVWADGWFKSISPFSEMHLGGGLYVSCKDGELQLSTPWNWKGALDPSRQNLHPTEHISQGDYFFATSREETDFSKDLGDWKALDFDDSSWQELQRIARNAGIHGYNLNGDTGVVSAMEMPQVRPMKREPLACKTLDAPGTTLGIQADGSLKGTLPAGHSESLVSLEKYLTGYIQLAGSAAKGTILLRQFEKPDESHWQEDVMHLCGKAWQMETFELRAANYLRVIADLEEPMEFSLKTEFYSYDFGTFREFHAQDKMLEKIYQVGIHTARCCAHDTYEDCPFYERFQYEGDTRVQALISYEATGNGELGRKAILDFSRSQAANGLVQSRFPSSLPQYIPGYALIWILMIEDYQRYFHDAKLLHQLFWGIQGVIRYYTDLVDKTTGLAGHPGFWAFSDWTQEWNDSYGDPSRDKKSPTAIENLLFAYALQAASRLAKLEGEEYLAERWDALQRNIIQAVNKNLFDEAKGIYRDVPGKDWYSRHAQALAILTNAVPAQHLPSVKKALLEDIPGMSVCSLYFQFYVLDALRMLGDKEGVRKALAPWYACLEESPWLTTFPEVSSATSSRSMCHAWSSAPVFFLLKSF